MCGVVAVLGVRPRGTGSGRSRELPASRDSTYGLELLALGLALALELELEQGVLALPSATSIRASPVLAPAFPGFTFSLSVSSRFRRVSSLEGGPNSDSDSFACGCWCRSKFVTCITRCPWGRASTFAVYLIMNCPASRRPSNASTSTPSS